MQLFEPVVNDVWDEYSELKDLNIPVHYYKVADMKTPAGTYEGSLDGGEWEALKSVEYKVVQSTRDQSIEIKVKDVERWRTGKRDRGQAGSPAVHHLF